MTTKAEQLTIAEIFVSRQGEGQLTGMQSFFIRTSGCNLRCWFCDTPYTSWHPEGEKISIAAIVEQAVSSNCRHVVITGGEPMLQPGIQSLCDELAQRGLHITIETAGTIFRQLQCHLMSISPKLSNSTPDPAQHPLAARRHEQRRFDIAAMNQLLDEYCYQLKFVVDSPEDCAEIEAYLKHFPQVPADRVWLMPQGIDQLQLEQRAQWLQPYCAQHGFHYCPRMHIQWYGNKRGT